MSVQIPDSAFPISWPASWPRWKGPRPYARFQSSSRVAGWQPGTTRISKKAKSMNDATELLIGELSRLGASRSVVSTNVAVRLDGLPYANQKPPSDPGAAIYFVLKSKPIVLACDKWDRVEDNVYAIARHIESIRAQERWGVGRIEQAFAGYMALPAPLDLKPWWEVFGVREIDDRELVEKRYRHLAKINHPDAGGDHANMVEINTAWENAKLSRGWN